MLKCISFLIFYYIRKINYIWLCQFSFRLATDRVQSYVEWERGALPGQSERAFTVSLMGNSMWA